MTYIEWMAVILVGGMVTGGGVAVFVAVESEPIRMAAIVAAMLSLGVSALAGCKIIDWVHDHGYRP